MQKTQLAAQLYTLREYLKTPRDIAESLKKVRGMGYQAVQISGLGPIDDRELKAIADDLGLEICATHIPYESMEKDLQSVMDTHTIYGCSNIGIGGLPSAYRNAEGFHAFALAASKIALRLADNGFNFIYHNHSFELERFGDRTGLDILYGESDPRCFLAEIDTYWIQHGGGDPIYWIKRLAGRLPVIHLKDMAVRGGKPTMSEIGEGNLNWEAILPACKEAGVAWYVVEQDTDFLVDPFTSLKTSFDNLTRMGLK